MRLSGEGMLQPPDGRYGSIHQQSGRGFRTLLGRQQEQVNRLAPVAGGTRDLPSIIDVEGIEKNPIRSLW